MFLFICKGFAIKLIKNKVIFWEILFLNDIMLASFEITELETHGP